MVKEIGSETEYKDAVGKGACIVDFYAVWCGPCNMIKPKLEELEKQYTGKINFYKVDVDKLSSVAQMSQVTAMPTFLVFLDGKLKDTIVGADIKKVTTALTKLAAEMPAGASSSTA